MNLIKGYKKFYQKHFVVQPAIYKELAEKGQKPRTLIIACSDSRVDPANLTGAGAGEIFVVRHVASLVPSFDDDEHNRCFGAALEFAVKTLKVKHIVVKGHADCGGVQALLDDKVSADLPLVSDWMKPYQGVVDAAREKEDGDDLQTRCEKACIVKSLQNLRTYSFVVEQEQAGNITIHGWYFCLTSGQLYDYDHKKQQFVSML